MDTDQVSELVERSNRMHSRIQALEQQLAATTQSLGNVTHALEGANATLAVLQSSNPGNLQGDLMQVGKPEKFSGYHARSWLMSLENVFNSVRSTPSETAKISYAISFMKGAALEWWDLVRNSTSIVVEDFDSFKRELLAHFEPVNRDETAREKLRSIRQMGKLNRIKDYNREFSHWLLLIPSMDIQEQIFHYKHGLKRSIRIEVTKSDPKTLHEAMKIADRMDTIYNSVSFNVFSSERHRGGPSYSSHASDEGPTPMQIGNIHSSQRRFQRVNVGISKPTLTKKFGREPRDLPTRRGPWLPLDKKKQYIQEKRCFVCGKTGCRASQHPKN